MHLYNKNILKYAKIAQSGPKTMILNIEGHSCLFSIYRKQKRIQSNDREKSCKTRCHVNKCLESILDDSDPFGRKALLRTHGVL